MISGKQTNLEGAIETWDIRRILSVDIKTQINELENEIFNKEFELTKLESELKRCNDVINRKFIEIDTSSDDIVINYRSDLFEQLIEEFTKLYDWMDTRASYFKIPNPETESHILIDTEQVELVIEMFNKLGLVIETLNRFCAIQHI